ncbi:hypothetical protein F2Q69_00032559 [Brassica cretica]|uniref:Uncharacterized protein n=1 Tax=Brassica cretica TaxID=69181 RepID=A0A8S9RSV3_BRACR|nr:hypothetical protein F2Q69_00032559 [Brassica cretica]
MWQPDNNSFQCFIDNGKTIWISTGFGLYNQLALYSKNMETRSASVYKLAKFLGQVSNASSFQSLKLAGSTMLRMAKLCISQKLHLTCPLSRGTLDKPFVEESDLSALTGAPMINSTPC